MKYEQIYDGDWNRFVWRGAFIACCDCGLVHRVNTRVRNGCLELQHFREARRTAAKRRRKKPRYHCRPR